MVQLRGLGGYLWNLLSFQTNLELVFIDLEPKSEAIKYQSHEPYSIEIKCFTAVTNYI